MKKISTLEKKLGLKIEDKELFQRALTHISYVNENPKTTTSNEKLEFLGDSIISFTVADFLYKNLTELSEGEYTDIRGKLVSREGLAKVGKNLGLGDLVFLSKGEEKIGGRENPTILADTYEAIVGAIYLQSGLKVAKKFIVDTLIKPFLPLLLKKKAYVSAKTRLQEYIQKKYHKLPHYEIISTKGPDHKKEYKVAVFFEDMKIAEGEGTSKKRAEEEAARRALEKIEKKEVEI